MARKLCSICKLRTVGTGGGRDLQQARAMGYCGPCMDEADWENVHNDDDHEGVLRGDVVWGMTTHKTKAEFTKWMNERKVETKDCWVCHPELNLATDRTPKAERKGHRSPRRPQMNHRACNHPQTPKARRECRNAFWKAQAGDHTEGKFDLTTAEGLDEMVLAEPKPNKAKVKRNYPAEEAALCALSSAKARKAKPKPADTGVHLRTEYTEAEKVSMEETGKKTAAIGEQMAKRRRKAKPSK